MKKLNAEVRMLIQVC